ncbi:SWIM zinc finger family protein [Bacillus kexueae]|uniref:SWIM zinc finger family protein n=1 Tax=Aeribacillus kexueae TaxID=2078952 RepID=UPI001FB01720|nr:SWIM zinc finger family protein [Bacillus kexueae]
MLAREIKKEQVLSCGESVLKYLSPTNEEHQQLVKKGLLLYRQGLVFNVKVSNAVVRASVQDVTPVKVSLDLDYAPMSSCSCPKAYPCRHLLAVLFYVYATSGLLGSFLEEWKRGEERGKLAKLTEAGLIKKGSDLKLESVESWYRLFHQEWNQLSHRLLSPNQLIQSVYRQLYPKLKRSAPWKQELKPLYFIHVGLFTLDRMLTCLKEQHVSEDYQNQVMFSYVNALQEEVTSGANQLRVNRQSFSLESNLHDSVPYVRELLTNHSPFLFERFSIYRTIWLKVLVDLLEEEKTWVEESVKEHPHSLELTLASLNIAFMEGRDKDVIDRLADFDAMMVPYSLDWFGDIVEQKAWERFSPWKDYYIQFIGQFLHDDLPSYMKRQVVDFLIQQFEEYADETGDMEVLIEACHHMLPYSFGTYNALLLERESYTDWLDLQDVTGLVIEDFETSFIKRMEKEAPHALIPLLHRAVQQRLLEKNRASYKQAVRHLKRLKRMYKKDKKIDVWESYFQKIVEQHKRLRAFQEELKKGKLLDDE